MLLFYDVFYAILIAAGKQDTAEQELFLVTLPEEVKTMNEKLEDNKALKAKLHSINN